MLPGDPSDSEQEDVENSLDEKRTEEHWESGRQEEEEEKVATKLSPPNLPPLLLLKLLLVAAICPCPKPLP